MILYKAYIEVKQEYDKAESSEDNRIREISFWNMRLMK